MKKFSNLHNISLPMAVFLAHETYDFEPSEKSISVTSLMKSTRQIILGSRLKEGDATLEDISNLVASRIGTAIHGGIEAAWLNPLKAMQSLGFPKKTREKVKINPENWTEDDLPVWIELRTSKEINGLTVSGCADMILEGAVHDVKSTGIFAYMSGSMNGKYRLQLSIYRWLNQDKVTSDMGYIEYFFKDWDKLDAGYKTGYPPLPIMQQPIPLLSLRDTEQYLIDKINELNTYWDMPEEEIPLCSAEDLWAGKSVWQYFGKLGSTRASKNFDTQAEANTWAASKGKGFVKYKEGKAKACNYCRVRDTCSQYATLKATGGVVINN
jgi:hypothetical protein